MTSPCAKDSPGSNPGSKPDDRARSAADIITRIEHCRDRMFSAPTSEDRYLSEALWRASRAELAGLLGLKSVPIERRPDTTTQRILVVEDDPDAAGAVADMLSSAGYQTLRAEGVGEARSLTRELKPDLLLVDVALPDGNGLLLARTLSYELNVPVVIMTALPSFELDAPLGAVSCVKYVVFKPCSMRTLLNAVRQALSTPMHSEL